MSSLKNYITKHKSYIDRRIDIISHEIEIDFAVNYLISENQIIIGKDISRDSIDALFELRNLLPSWDILNDGDIIGYVYQNLEGKRSKKRKGQYFTPGEIVEYICNSSISIKKENYSDLKILDPACGSGQFLHHIFKQLLNLYIEDGISLVEASERIIKNQIYGFDIDNIAIQIAKFNLAKISGIEKEKINIYNSNFLYKDELNFTNEYHTEKNYDIIIGNPPWGSSMSSEEKKYFNRQYHSSKTGLNSFTLFIERSFDYINKQGVISYLIPEAYLNIKAHMASRKLVLNSTQIDKITIWGEQFKNVFSPSISIEMIMSDISEKKKSNIVKIIRGKKDYQTLVPQESFRTNHETIFNINYSRKATNIISLIDKQECEYLKDRSKFFLGIVTGNNAKYISGEQSDEFPDPILTGKDLNQYKINFSNHYFKFNTEILQQTAPIDLYKNSNKILYKFIGKKLTFANDTNGIYSLNNINGFINGIYSLNTESLLSILNSRIIQYYYEKSFFTLKVLKGNLERLPLKKINIESQKRIKDMVNEMQYHGDSNSRIRENIEDILFFEYGLKDKDISYISENSL